jgi:DNA topoisomerase-6 subunit B
MTQVEFQSISPSDFFYRNREIAGFSNPSRAIYAAVRELLENSLDACEARRIPPNIFIRITEVMAGERDNSIYLFRIEDNGTGVSPEHIPKAFGQVFYGSKYTLKQARGPFGLGGTMAILYGQITTHKPVVIMSSTGGDIHEYEMMIDIQRNRATILKRRVRDNPKRWRGTILQLFMEGDYTRIMHRLVEYIRQTAMVNPYAEITFIGPRGRLYKYERATTTLPPLPEAVKPHPHGVDVETVRRIIAVTGTKNMKDFMMEHFQNVGAITSEKFLEAAGINPRQNPKTLNPDDIVRVVRMAKDYDDFIRPDASCLSPIGVDLLETGIIKELGLTEGDFIKAVQRKPSTYLGFPFIVEVALASGNTIRKRLGSGITIYRFANRIPLLFDESSGVVWKAVYKNINWKTYRVDNDTPLVVAIHVCSTKIPYKSVGKEYMADQPEVEKEITNAIRSAARALRIWISKKRRIARHQRRLNVFNLYLPKIAEFSTKLSGQMAPPDIQPLIDIVEASTHAGSEGVVEESLEREG